MVLLVETVKETTNQRARGQVERPCRFAPQAPLELGLAIAGRDAPQVDAIEGDFDLRGDPADRPAVVLGESRAEDLVPVGQLVDCPVGTPASSGPRMRTAAGML